MFYREAGDFKTSYSDDNQTFPIKFDRYRYYVVLAVAFGLIPFLINDYWANAFLLPFLIYSIAAIGLNILTGYCGQVSLGTGGFMAVGAYACYKLMTGFPEINIFFLAVATLAAQFFLVWLFNKVAWFYNYSASGQINAPERFVFGVPVTGANTDAWATYLFCLVFLAISAIIARNFLVLFMIIIGGLGSIFGSFAGAAFLVLLPVALKLVGVDLLGWPTDIVAHIQLIIVGALIIIFLIAEPHGIAQLWRVAKEKLRLWPFPH